MAGCADFSAAKAGHGERKRSTVSRTAETRKKTLLVNSSKAE